MKWFAYALYRIVSACHLVVLSTYNTLDNASFPRLSSQNNFSWFSNNFLKLFPILSTFFFAVFPSNSERSVLRPDGSPIRPVAPPT